MHYRSETFTGTWPMGFHWTPGEVRDVPESAVRADDPNPPDGLVPHLFDGGEVPAPSRKRGAR